MTDNEIIKALECKGGGKMDCLSCPYSPRYPDCDRGAARDAIRLINRQKAKIERLKVECGKAQYEKYRADFEEFRAEIKADAVKEFAERLKDKFDKYGVDYTAYTMGDDIVREMGVEQ